MEIDHVTYIFGSFSRRKIVKDTSGTQTRARVRTPSDNIICRNDSKTINSDICDDSNSFTCPLCKNEFIEPRVLPCLHTFCTPCLSRLEATYNTGGNKECVSENRINECFSSDYLVQLTSSSSYKKDDLSSAEGSVTGCNGFPSLCNMRQSFSMMCPTCDTVCKLPLGGVTTLPPNYVIQHRMVLASLNKNSTRLLCDTCSSENTASFRCMDCMLNLCLLCQEIHISQKETSSHEVLQLNEARRKGITKIRSQAMCPLHPDFELEVFCIPCRQVACRQCCRSFHKGHKPRETASSASQAFANSVCEIMSRVKPFLEKTNDALCQLDSVQDKIEAICDQTETEINNFIDGYITALEDHRNSLQHQLQQIRKKKMKIIEEQRQDIQRRSNDTLLAMKFTENLLSEGSQVELLSFVEPILDHLQWCCDGRRSVNRFLEPKVSDIVQFLPHKKAGVYDIYTIYGVLVTQTVSPQLCILNTDGFQNCRQNQNIEAVLHTVDSEGQPLRHGGENVSAELHFKDATHRQVPVQVCDQKDGTYLISLIPDTCGTFSLSVSVNSKPVRKSPFHIRVRNTKPHRGKFHCCSFCSSKGNKDVACGCGGTMPGGYKGCGHGHVGHPGRRHWSCCGNTNENSLCTRHVTSAFYQYTL